MGSQRAGVRAWRGLEARRRMPTCRREDMDARRNGDVCNDPFRFGTSSDLETKEALSNRLGSDIDKDFASHV
jgi:hypothetical protein